MAKLGPLAVCLVSALALPGVASSARASLPSSAALADQPPPPPSNPKCVVITAEARYRSGYEHLVHIGNGCDQPVSCDVSTDVTPEIIKATVAAHGSETILTRRGSPSSVFVARVLCTLQ